MYLICVDVDFVEVFVVDWLYLLEVVEKFFARVEVGLDEHFFDSDDLFFFELVDLFIDFELSCVFGVVIPLHLYL